MNSIMDEFLYLTGDRFISEDYTVLCDWNTFISFQKNIHGWKRIPRKLKKKWRK